MSGLKISTDGLRAGTRLGVAVSGGADSVALLRVLAEERQRLGWVLTVLHVHHGIRGAEADGDVAFVEALAAELGLSFLRKDVDTPQRVRVERESVEEAARNLRYAWFDELLSKGLLDVVATAHTLDDQTETVLHKLLRGAWTEGLAGIFPVVEKPVGRIVRPLLDVRRAEIETWLRGLGQAWREDSTNRETVYTRNRIRHELLPVLEGYNPRVREQMSHMAALAREEEAYWQGELKRVLPSLLLPGRAVRGGGRASSTHPDEAAVAIEVERLKALHPALRRRVLRAAAEQVGGSLGFDQTETLLALVNEKAGRRELLAADLQVERTARELRLIRKSVAASLEVEYVGMVPGEIAAPAFGLRILVRGIGDGVMARLRAARAGDRVLLRYTRGPKRVKEVLERMQVPPSERAGWPVLEWKGEIVWMRGAEVEGGLSVEVLEDGAQKSP